jgi:hypothetical protein
MMNVTVQHGFNRMTHLSLYALYGTQGGMRNASKGSDADGKVLHRRECVMMNVGTLRLQWRC